LLAVAYMDAVSPAYSSEIQRQSFYSAVLARDFNYRIYIPDGYEGSIAAYPVLYLLHGAGGNEDSYIESGGIKETADRLIKEKAIPPALIVMPGCKGCWWVDGSQEKAESAFWTELVPTIDALYKTNPSREGRLIAGNSAGGYGAIRFGLRYPDRVGAVAALSPAVYATEPPPSSAARRQSPFLNSGGSFDEGAWTRLNYPALLPAYFKQPLRLPFYLLSGDDDPLGIAYETALLFKQLYADKTTVIKLRIVDGRHSWDVWRPGIAEAMKFLFRSVDRPQQIAHVSLAKETK